MPFGYANRPTKSYSNALEQSNPLARRRRCEAVSCLDRASDQRRQEMRREGPVILSILLAAVFAFSVAGHADELSDLQAKQLREQNQALTKRVADLERRQQKLEKKSTAQAQPAMANRSLSDAMAADLPYKTVQKAPAPASDDLCWNGVCLYGTIEMGLTYQNHGAPLSPLSGSAL